MSMMEILMSDRIDVNIHNLLELCATADVATNAALKVEKNGLSLAVFNLAGEYYVTDDLCTHGPGSLSEGYLEGEVIECDFHNGAFNIRTGAVVTPPCMIPLKTYAVHTIDGKVYIDPDQRAASAIPGKPCTKPG